MSDKNEELMVPYNFGCVKIRRVLDYWGIYVVRMEIFAFLCKLNMSVPNNSPVV